MAKTIPQHKLRFNLEFVANSDWNHATQPNHCWLPSRLGVTPRLASFFTNAVGKAVIFGRQSRIFVDGERPKKQRNRRGRNRNRSKKRDYQKRKRHNLPRRLRSTPESERSLSSLSQ
uniref:Uncharacterized protein n=1 Tax=Vitis vinifera TaxID=29760 RepID=A5BTW8_VITVI|nr:hypothetical protein VITISV_008474 [Vitis vinifera]